jgi:hypothetical protein
MKKRSKVEEEVWILNVLVFACVCSRKIDCPIACEGLTLVKTIICMHGAKRRNKNTGLYFFDHVVGV